MILDQKVCIEEDKCTARNRRVFFGDRSMWKAQKGISSSRLREKSLTEEVFLS